MERDLQPRARHATLREVARRAGVSQMTVSNVVNGNFGEMRKETRERVEDAIRDLGYRPRGMARGLRLDRNFAIGLLIVDPLSTFLADEFISQVVAGASNILGESGYGCLLHGVTPGNFDKSLFFTRSSVDGICAFMSGEHAIRRSYLDRLLALGVPVIGIEETNRDIGPNFAVVGQDDFGAAYEMAKRLLASGCRRFFVLAPSMSWPSVTERIEGIRHAIGQSPEPTELELITCGTGTIPEAEAVFGDRVSAIPPNAGLIGATDRLSLAVARIVRKLPAAAEVPKTAAFSSSDASRDPSIFDVIALSNPYRIGTEAGRRMIMRLSGSSFSEQVNILGVDLLPRSP